MCLVIANCLNMSALMGEGGARSYLGARVPRTVIHCGCMESGYEADELF